MTHTAFFSRQNELWSFAFPDDRSNATGAPPAVVGISSNADPLTDCANLRKALDSFLEKEKAQLSEGLDIGAWDFFRANIGKASAKRINGFMGSATKWIKDHGPWGSNSRPAERALTFP